VSSSENFGPDAVPAAPGAAREARGPAHTRPDRVRGVYSISIAAELVGTAVHNLRVYEARGLLAPARSGGGTRRYSEADVARLREIARLLDAGLNLAGIEMVLTLQAEVRALRAQLATYESSTAPEGGSDGDRR
jgi:MerR family transcriptional regulator, heat shock protein HspR